MATSDLIANFILSAIEGSGEGFAELQRSALAERFSCVPSQINYVISTRFSPERGYVVESRRGGGGYIRITRVQRSPRELIMHTVNAVGDRLEARTAGAFVSNIYEAGLVDRATARLLLAAVSDRALRAVPASERDTVRAGILKQMLVTLISE
ncbi:MAG: CtsR family transcriptional regulator [Oscillospiraceae bacterium]|nr:CtsR family transcriptional regulator [Oscillospiraceae bacterium]